MIRLLISEQSLYLNSKLNEYINSVIDFRDDFNYCIFDFEETPIQEIIDSLESPAFGSDKKVVVCKNPYFIKDEKMKLSFPNDVTLLDSYLKNPNEDTELIIICPSKYNNPKSKFLSKIREKGEVENLLFEDENAFVEYGNALIRSSGMIITNDAKRILFERCMSDVCKLEREIAKLAMYNDEIDLDLVSKFVSRPLEDDIFELSNALMARDRKKIMNIYSDLKLLKVEPINLISLLANQYRLLMQVSILHKKHKGDPEIATILNIHPYRVKLASKYVQQYNLDEVKNILCDLATIDAKIKSGELDRYVDFELFLATK